MSSAELPEELITLIQVVAEDDSLSRWFEELEGISDAARASELIRMAAEMEAGGEDVAVVEAVQLLAHPKVYLGACAAMEVARASR